MDPAVPPAGILAGQPPDQRPDATPGRRPPGPAARGPGAPAAADDVAVPAHDRVRGDQQPQPLAPRFRCHGEQGGEQGPVRPVQLRAPRLPPLKDGELVAQDQDLCGLHASSHRDSRSHAANRVIRRKTNRRHMIGDHHGRTAGGTTLLVRAVDGILGTHRSYSANGACLEWAIRWVNAQVHPYWAGVRVCGGRDQGRVDIATGAPVLVDPGSTLCGCRTAYSPLRGPSCRRYSRSPARPCAASPRTPGAGSPLMPSIPGTRRSWR
jgi:hypothetical protein